MCHASSNFTTTFVYHFCWYGWLLYGVRVEYHPNAFYQIFKDFSFESATRFDDASPSYHSSNIHVSGRLFSGDLLASVLPVLPLLGGKVPTFKCYIYTYIFLKKNVLINSGRNGKIGRSAHLSHQLSYHFY